MKFFSYPPVCAAASALALIAGSHEAAAQPTTASEQVVASMNRGVSYMGQYQYSDAARAFEQVLELAPGLQDARINLAIALFNRNGQEDLAAAESLLRQVLEKNPVNVRALYFQAIVLQHIGKAEDAIPLLATVLEKRPDDGAAWYLLALCKQRVGQAAENEFLKAIQFRPYLFSAYYQLYQASMRAGKQAQAMQYVERFKALRESPLGESLEFPQYNQMGDLALVLPIPAGRGTPIAKSQFRLRTGQSAYAWSEEPYLGDSAMHGSTAAAAGDLDRDGRPDLLVSLGPTGRLVFLRGSDAGFVDATPNSGLEAMTNIVSCAMGDFDNDEHPDLCVISPSGARLLRSNGEGRFADVTASVSLSESGSRSALFLDADHDGDLDLFVCGRETNQLWNNNGNGSFTNIANQAGIACLSDGAVQVLPGDIDGDRDMDLVILLDHGPAKVFLNELLGRYRQANRAGVEIRGEAGGVLQDMNGDGLLDLVALGGDPRQFEFWIGDGQGKFQASDALSAISRAAATWGPLRGFRAVDVDLDGDLDLVCAGGDVHLVLNDGQGRFVLRSKLWTPPEGNSLAAFEIFDVTGDFVPDLITSLQGGSHRIELARGELAPPSTALAIQPSGVRSRDGRTRSPASGYGVRAVARAGLREQGALYTGQSGGLNQSLLPMVFGLGGAASADYIQLRWPDGVSQVEIGLAAGQSHKVAELQRKVSSCPVLFAWNGARFAFVTDFAGVGGLGYFQSPGISAPPQVLEYIKMEPDQLQPRDGYYELRVTEPMEESAYIDRLELLAVDHPSYTSVFPDERLAISGPSPTHELVFVNHPIFPVAARDPDGRVCTDHLLRADRVFAYLPALDKRYVGFCRPHTLELDFGDRLSDVNGKDPVYLFIKGYIEYPYSQTVYAAGQSKVTWEPIRIDAQNDIGEWETIVADGGIFGGLDRMMTIKMPQTVLDGARKLRLTSNLEVFYDQAFIAAAVERDGVTVQTIPLQEATLRYLGFPREYSPDGREPLIYDYDLCDATAPFDRLKGAYTRYGRVDELLTSFDDQYVLVGSGDEIAMKFRAAGLSPPGPGRTRSFILISHAYCKDMDLYTATSHTLEPLPFKDMSRYPYPARENYPATEANEAFRRTYNTRLVQ